MRSGDVALRLSIVFSVAGFIALATSLYEVDRREKSSSGTAAANLAEIEQHVQILSNQIGILSNQITRQLSATERQAQALSSQIQALDLRLKELENDLRGRR
jgi:septal ring factor EnvC (AmiA/AmiB activator)